MMMKCLPQAVDIHRDVCMYCIMYAYTYVLGGSQVPRDVAGRSLLLYLQGGRCRITYNYIQRADSVKYIYITRG